MNRFLASLLISLAVASSAFAGSSPPPSNPITATGSATPRLLQDRFAQQVNVKDYGALGAALTYSDGAITSGTTAFCSNGATFSVADVGKLIQIDGAGAGGVTGAPLATTIAAFVSTHCVTLTNAASTTTPQSYFAYTSVATSRVAGNYVPGETITLTGGTSSVGAVATVQDTLVTAATINAAGTGGTNGACILTGTTGAGTFFKINATITGGAISALGSFTETGHYFTKPTSLSAEPVTSAPGNLCAPTGATLTLTMGVETVYISTAGAYTVVPANPVATGAGSISGATGATLTATWNTSGGFVYGADDSAAVVRAINAASTRFATGSPAYVYAPSGAYLIDANALPTMGSGLGIVGDGADKTNFIVGASYSGDLFSWSEAWLVNALPLNGAFAQVAGNKSTPRVVGFSVWGNRRAAAQQNAMVFYDRDDQIYLDDVDVYYINGRCLYSGVTKNTSQAYMRESRINRLRCFGVGAASAPVVEFNSVGSGDATNEIDIGELDIFSPYGTGFLVRNGNTAVSVRNFRITKLRIEGLQSNVANVAADLVTIGDPVLTGIVNNIYFDQLELLDPYTNQAAFRVTAPSAATQPYFIRVGGTQGAGSTVGGGLPLGYGVKVDAGRNLYFHLAQIFSWSTNFSVASTTTTGSQIVVDGDGQEGLWTYNVDATANGNIVSPVRKTGYTGSTSNGTFPATVPVLADFTTIGGNTRGSGSVDLQTLRVLPSQVTSGVTSVIAGGNQNIASGLQVAIGGGFVNSATGTTTAIPGGARVTDRGLAGGLFYASACQSFQLVGACQRGLHTLGNTTSSTSATRLTSNAAGAGSTNCLNLPVGTAYQTAVRVMARDRTNGTDLAAWNSIQGMLTRGSGNAAYAGQDTVATTPDNSVGTGSTATIQLAADTTNQCLSVTWVAPNTDIWDVTATVDTAEVQ